MAEIINTFPQKMSSEIETICSAITNVIANLKYAHSSYRPNVVFEGNIAKFIISEYRIIRPNTAEMLKRQFSSSIKQALDYAKMDINDMNLGYSFETSFIEDKIDMIKSRGLGSKSYITYTQTWQIDIV